MVGRSLRCLVAIALAVTLSTPAAAEVGRRRRALAVGAVFLPGVVLHGSGHLVAGDRRTALRLLAVEVTGAALSLLGCRPIQVSGAAPATLPGLALCVPGVSLFLHSWMADLFGTVGAARVAGAPMQAARLELESGYILVHGARDNEHLGAFAATAHLDRATVIASGYGGGDIWGARGELGVRALRKPEAHLDLVLGATERRFDGEGFRASTLELSVRGRYELGRLAPTLVGSFATVEIGAAREQLRYRVENAGVDVSSMLIARAGFGMRVGDDAEVELSFDQRRDTLAGARPVWRTSFTDGFVGVRAIAFRGRYGVASSLEVGSSWVGRLALVIRIGTREAR